MDWSELAAPYFENVCTQELDGYFSRYEFQAAETKGRVVYVRKPVAFEFTYHVEDAPRYLLMMAIGVQENAGIRWLPIWPLLPHIDTVREWKFATEDELRGIIRSVRDDVLERIARPLWDNEEQLRRLLDEHEDRLRAAHEHRKDEELLERARRAFDAKHFSEAVEAYGLLGTEGLSSLDQKRQAYAQKRV